MSDQAAELAALHLRVKMSQEEVETHGTMRAYELNGCRCEECRRVKSINNKFHHRNRSKKCLSVDIAPRASPSGESENVR